MKIYAQLPSFKRWTGVREADSESRWKLYQSQIRRIDQAISLIDLFWPEFIIWKGLLLRSDSLPEDINGYIAGFRENDLSDSQIEYVVNHLHLADQFMNDPDRDKVGDEALSFLANAISRMWACRLKADFPDQVLDVGVNENEGDPEVYAQIVRE